jgi:hypothetical protein
LKNSGGPGSPSGPHQKLKFLLLKVLQKARNVNIPIKRETEFYPLRPMGGGAFFEIKHLAYAHVLHGY